MLIENWCIANDELESMPKDNPSIRPLTGAALVSGTVPENHNQNTTNFTSLVNRMVSK